MNNQDCDIRLKFTVKDIGKRLLILATVIFNVLFGVRKIQQVDVTARAAAAGCNRVYLNIKVGSVSLTRWEISATFSELRTQPSVTARSAKENLL
jgi:hypothetical protein